jgi:hypothetical protein
MRTSRVLLIIVVWGNCGEKPHLDHYRARIRREVEVTEVKLKNMG